MSHLSNYLFLAFYVIFLFNPADYFSLHLPGFKQTHSTEDVKQKFIYGINGHPMDALPSPYAKVPLEQQLQLVKDLGMNYYRLEVGVSPFGYPTNPYKLNPLFTLALQYGIKILPMVYPRGMNLTGSAEANYTAGKTLGSGFARRYGQYLDYYELGNEQENRLLNKGVVGDKATDYDIEKVKIVASFLKGMSEGIKSEDPGAKTMTSVGWLHYGFLKLLAKYGYNFDVIDYHWYSDMESTAKTKYYKIDNIADKLIAEFPGKPIWFTEINSKKGSLESGSQQQSQFINSFIAKVKGKPEVEAIFIYELFDEPQKEPNERDYGIINWPSSFQEWNFKSLGKELKMKKSTLFN